MPYTLAACPTLLPSPCALPGLTCPTLSPPRQADDALRKLDTDLSSMKQQLVGLEAGLRGRDRDLARQLAALEAARGEVVLLEGRCSQAEQAAR